MLCVRLLLQGQRGEVAEHEVISLSGVSVQAGGINRAACLLISSAMAARGKLLYSSIYC